MKDTKKEKITKKESNFSLKISLIIFFYSTLMFLIGLFKHDVLYSFWILIPILLILVIIICVYTLLTHKKRSFIDYIVLSILFLAVLSITIQNFIYLYRPRTGDYYYSLNYNFPGILNFNKHWLVSVDPLKYELVSTMVLFDPTLISSIVCIIISIVKYKRGGR